MINTTVVIRLGSHEEAEAEKVESALLRQFSNGGFHIVEVPSTLEYQIRSTNSDPNNGHAFFALGYMAAMLDARRALLNL